MHTSGGTNPFAATTIPVSDTAVAVPAATLFEVNAGSSDLDRHTPRQVSSEATSERKR